MSCILNDKPYVLYRDRKGETNIHVPMNAILLIVAEKYWRDLEWWTESTELLTCDCYRSNNKDY